MRFGFLIIVLLLTATGMVRAQSVNDDVRAYFRASSISERTAAIARLESAVAEGNDLAAFVTGTAMFFDAVQGFGSDLARHGFESPSSFMVPLFRLPVPENPNPEPLDYAKFRKIFEDFESRLETASSRLGSVSEIADIGIEVDFATFGLDLDGDDSISSEESLAGIISTLQPRGRRNNSPPETISFRFDRADGFWLQGYANFLMAAIDFWLAHDFGLAFDQSFHMFFPRANLPLQDDLVPNLQNGQGTNIVQSEWKLVDFVSLIHLTNWQVAHPERRADTRRHLLEMIALSRKNWRAIRAETDNDREWLPGPHQPGKNLLTGLEVGEEQVGGWHDALNVAEELLNGKKLLAHFRFFGKGFNMQRFFDEPQPFDFVMILTGPGATAYMEAGDTVSTREWREVTRQFGRGGFTPFAIWFN